MQQTISYITRIQRYAVILWLLSKQLLKWTDMW